MDYRKFALTALLLLSAPAFANYVSMTPPPGWTPGVGPGGQFDVKAAQLAGAAINNARLSSQASINFVDKVVKVPVRSYLSNQGVRAAAGLIFANPYIRLAVGVSSWLTAGKLIYDATTGAWNSWDSVHNESDGFTYRIQWRGYNTGSRLSVADAAQAWSNYYAAYQTARPEYVWWNTAVHSINGLQVTFRHTYLYASDGKIYTADETVSAIKGGVSTCPTGWYVVDGGCVQTPPGVEITEEEFIDEIVKNPMPDTVPAEVGKPLPFELPDGDPVFVPTGSPYANPAYDPLAAPSPTNQPYIQPGVRIVPTPSVSNPWGAEVVPVNRPVASPVPNPDPVVDPTPAPGQDGPGSGDQNPPRDPSSDFCKLNPTVLACQVMDRPEDPGPLPTQEIDFSFTPESGFAGAGVCPSPLSFSIGSQVITWRWDNFCNQLAIIRPLLLAFAWLAAAFIMLGARKE